MADIEEESNWNDGVYQLETTDPVQGGPTGIDNIPHKALANRTLWLKAQLLVKALVGGKATQRFKVAAAVSDDEAVNKNQLETFIKSGEILQVIYTKDINTYTSNTAKFEYLNTLITPKSTTSKLYIDITVCFGKASGNGLDGGFHLEKDGVVVPTGLHSDTSRGGNDVFFSNDTMLSESDVISATASFEVDSISLDEKEFKVTLDSGGNTRTWNINCGYITTYTRGLSTMRIMEVEV